jgi:hypothetical protein
VRSTSRVDDDGLLDEVAAAVPELPALDTPGRWPPAPFGKDSACVELTGVDEMPDTLMGLLRSVITRLPCRSAWLTNR